MVVNLLNKFSPEHMVPTIAQDPDYRTPAIKA